MKIDYDGEASLEELEKVLETGRNELINKQLEEEKEVRYNKYKPLILSKNKKSKIKFLFFFFACSINI